ERPLLYIGGGVVAARAVPALRAFEHATGLPAVCTLKALGALPAAHPLFLGMLGMHGSRAANLSVQASDLLVCVGARFDDRATGKLGGFAPHARVLHLDIDPAEVGKLRAADVTVLGDLRLSLAALSTTLEVQPWRDACMARRRADGPLAPPGGDAPIDAPDMFRQLSAHLDDRTFVTTDVGQHQMWAAQHVAVPSPELFITSGGLGTMGFGLPAAVGAQLGRPDARVVNITGDGSIMMNVQELGTIKRYALPVKILLCDNQTLGMVRQWQDLFFEQRYSETCLTDNPDFLTLARAFDIPGERISRADEVPGALARMLAAAGPYLLHVVLPRGNVWPLVPPGKDNGSMLEGA
ncbi:MAG TPA: thiamine pyrophosphate-dependent enzyme, partial [Myxococcota bacterium]|nr:thiamine pyrophosphate-dependent enzyme [Myxococcota bacterium]